MKEVLSPQEARKIILHSQKLPPRKQNGTALDTTLSAIEHLGYIQIDTISAVQRAHHHTLWNRNPRYELNHIDQLVSDKKVFEYWSHAAAYLPMKEFRFSLPRKQDLRTGAQKHWYHPDRPLMEYVLKRIEDEGPLMAKEFKGIRKTKNGWGAKPAKQALEYLFMQGDLMVAERRNFHKVYELTDRVLPANINRELPTPGEHGRFLLTNYLRANGIGQISEINYLLKNCKPLIQNAVKDMVHSGELITIESAGNTYYALPPSLKLLEKPLQRSRAKILSPFDNLLIQRKRITEIFQYDYQIECYLPEKKRKYGYFSLPILWNGQLVARIDCKAVRRENVLLIKRCHIEKSLSRISSFLESLVEELKLFASFNDCHTIACESPVPDIVQAAINGVRL